MTNVYTDNDLLSTYKQKRRYLTIFLVVTGIYLAACIGLCIYHSSLPYASDKAALPKVLVSVLSIVYVVIVFPFMAIKYHRVKRYHRMLSYINEGMKAEETNYFVAYRTRALQQDNVDAVVCIFGEWNKRHQEWREREVYIDAEKPLPDFENGDLVHYILQSNFLIHYEVLQRRAYDFTRVDEDAK
jgi:hypothetical protein